MFNVEKYAKFARQQRANGFQILIENYDLIAGIPVGGRVLDIGCGPGTVTQLLTYFTNLGEIFGTDFDPGMIEEAKIRNSDPRIFFQVWDVQKSPNFSQKFDLVTGNAMMHWIPDQKAALENIYNCLKPGGFFLAHFLAKPPTFSQLNEEKWKNFVKEDVFTIRKKAHRQPWMSVENPAEFYQKMIETEHKFKAIKCELRTVKNFYTELDLEEHCELQASNALKIDTPKEKFDEAVHEIKDFVKNKWETICNENGKFFVHKTERIILLAQKPKI